jgi:hypothetical protein
MPNTLIPIQTYTLSATTASVTFSNIPQNYTDLKIVASARTGRPASGSDWIKISFNGVTTNLSMIAIYAGGTTAGNYTDTSIYSTTNSNAQTASTFGSTEFYIANYTNSTHKTVLAKGVGETNDSTSNDLTFVTGRWSSTAAITSITLTPYTGPNFLANSTFTLYGISNGVKATGGTLTVAGGYAYHTFTSTGSFLPSQQIKGAEVLTIAGGGSGGEGATGYWQVGGGGGAGGVVYSNALNLTSGTTYTATVGAGGARAASRHGNIGNNSQFGPLTSAIGGGYGGAMSGIGGSLGPGGNGGNGGGNEGYGVWSRSTGSQGFGGGLGTNNQHQGGAGGGGGAGGQGSDSSAANGGNGGEGTSNYSVWANATGTGVSGFYAGGGGGAGSENGGSGGGTMGSGGSGGGSTGGVAGTANTGGGSGGNRRGNAVANGGSGIIIVRYPIL